MYWKRTTDATTEPITTAQAKAHLNIVDFTDDDTYIDILVAAARQKVEADTGRVFFNQTWKLYLDSFPDGVIRLPNAPLSSVASIKYYDVDNAQQTWTDTYYQSDTSHEPGRVQLGYGYSYPTTYSRLSAIEIEYVIGYGADIDTATTIPKMMFHAMYLLIGSWYEHREEVITGTIVSDLPDSVGYKALINNLKVGWEY